MATAASTSMSAAAPSGLESQQAQHYEDLDGAFAAEVAARAQAHAASPQGEILDDGALGNGAGGKAGDLPRNAQGRIMCPLPQCVPKNVTFDRKCEWTKHMDKHDRPYVCDEPGCEKLRGFTYSGGLLRHQREVHKKHGGPKEMLMCPFPYCKRNVGTGFTRKENLHEHIRRVHRGAPEPPGVPTQDAQDAQDGDGPAAQQAAQELQQSDISPTPQQQEPIQYQQDPMDPHQDRLVALQRSVQTYVPHSNKSRKRKSTSQVHEEVQYPPHHQDMPSLPSQTDPHHQQQTQDEAQSADLEKLDLLRTMEQSRLGHDEREELQQLREENTRLKMDLENLNARLQESESVVQFMTQQQEMRV
ncbi:hypothetical protein FH972_023413 [Carpinus fangiana]|uniref:C2H2-type domain-containing protein n=1 Tax=Carpinus fangiana TaxID=176857 RepID=A0A5N6KVG5_9ROSI|nr:hypothetical protein FH972_023413 [Carpinus fangiana]